MFFVEEKRNGQFRAEIYMRTDGLFEGRIYREQNEQSGPVGQFEVCAVTETLPPLEALVDEELGL